MVEREKDIEKCMQLLADLAFSQGYPVSNVRHCEMKALEISDDALACCLEGAQLHGAFGLDFSSELALEPFDISPLG